MDSLLSSKCLVYGWTLFCSCAVAESAYGASLAMNG